MRLLQAHQALQGKTAAVIGGAFGVGRAVTLKLAQSGLDIELLDNDVESLPAIRSEIEALGRKILAIEGDASFEGVLEGFYAQVSAVPAKAAAASISPPSRRIAGRRPMPCMRGQGGDGEFQQGAGGGAGRRGDKGEPDRAEYFPGPRWLAPSYGERKFFAPLFFKKAASCWKHVRFASIMLWLISAINFIGLVGCPAGA